MKKPMVDGEALFIGFSWTSHRHDSIVHNLPLLFVAKLKHEEGIQDGKVINAWQKDLAKRAEKASAAGRALPVKLYQALYRPADVSLQFIHSLRIGPCVRPVTDMLSSNSAHSCGTTFEMLDDRVQ